MQTEDISTFRESCHLRWLLPELQANLIQAESSLDSFTVSGDGEELAEYKNAIEACYGGLLMAEMPLCAAICEYLLACGAVLASDAGPRQKLICSAANQVLQQFPVLLEQYLSEREQSVTAWVLIMNELGAVLGRAMVSECAFLADDLSALTEQFSVQGYDEGERQKLSKVYQHALQKLLKGEEPAKHLAYLHKVCERLAQASNGDPLWKLSHSCITAVRSRKIKLGRSVRNLLRGLAAQIQTKSPVPEYPGLLASAALYTLAAGEEHWPQDLQKLHPIQAAESKPQDTQIVALLEPVDLDRLNAEARSLRQALVAVRLELSEAVEDGWNGAAIQQSPQYLSDAEQITKSFGGIGIADMLVRAGLFIKQVSENTESLPAWSRIDALIDLIVGLEFFAEHASKVFCPVQLKGLFTALDGAARLGVDATEATGEKNEVLSALPELLDSDPELIPSAPLAEANMAAVDEGFDPDILDIFLDEAEELLGEIAVNFEKWLKNSDDFSGLAELKRHTHTLKGGARMSGLSVLGNYAHLLETWLEQVLELIEQVAVEHKSQVVAEFGSAFVAAQDNLSQAVEDIRSPAEITPPSESNATVNFKTIAEEPSGELESIEENTTSEAGGKLAEAIQHSSQGDTLRVKTDLLEELVQLSWDGSSALTESELANAEASALAQRLRNNIERLSELLSTNTDYRFKELIEDFNGSVAALESCQSKVEQQQSRQRAINSQMQTGLLRTRTVPVSQLLPRLRRTVRSLAEELNKNVDFKVYTAPVELDKRVLDKLVPAFEHLLRNAIDHGIETPEIRSAAGKLGNGCISLRFDRDAGDVLIRLSDDGAGINLDKVRAKALSAGLISEDVSAETLSEQQLLDLIFQPGFSTADTVSEVSGRGVGMDAVRAEIRGLGGSISAKTGVLGSGEAGGTEFIIRVPFTMAGNKALLVEAVGQTWAIPFQAVDGVIQLNTWELQEYYSDEMAKLASGGQQYELHYLSSLLGGPAQPDFDDSGEEKTVFLVHGIEPPCALQVDRLIANRELLVRPLGEHLKGIPELLGSSVLGDGDIALVLNLTELVERRLGAPQDGSSEDVTHSAVVAGIKGQEAPSELTALVVDDSATARRIAGKVLIDEGFEVLNAEHGQDALDRLSAAKALPAVIVLDIDMPIMDGYAFAENVAETSDFSSIPIVIASSRDGELHQKRIDQLRDNGVKIIENLVKPYDSDRLKAVLQALELH